MDTNKILGYRELTDKELEQVKGIKRFANDLDKLLIILEDNNSDIDKRWLAIARTDLQKGIMALVRSVARPMGF